MQFIDIRKKLEISISNERKKNLFQIHKTVYCKRQICFHFIVRAIKVIAAMNKLMINRMDHKCLYSSFLRAHI